MSRPLSSQLLAGARLAPQLQDDANQSPLSVSLAGTADNLERYAGQCQDLVRTAIEPSLAGAPEWQIPLFQNIRRTGHSVDVMLVDDGVGRVHGVVPFQLQKHRWALPVPVISSWANDLFFTGVPLIDDAEPQAVVYAALNEAARTLGAKAAIFQMLPADGPFVETLHALAAADGLAIAEVDPFERAGLVCGKDFDDWFKESFQRKRRKEFRRLRNRLGEAGKLEFCQRAPGEPLQPWIDGFLALERAGWKGQRGTAVACLDEVTAFLNQSLGAFDESNSTLFWKLALDGKTIATIFAVIRGRKVWLLKIAHDEAYARYSPGVLLILDITRDLLARDDIDVVDSSAVRGHPMINHLWRDRLPITDIMIATPGTSAAMFNAMAQAERTKRRVRAFAKTVYLRYRKGRAK